MKSLTFTIRDVATLGRISRVTRRSQKIRMDDLSCAGNSFVHDFENGKPTVEMGRVLNVLDELGITVTVSVPITDEKTEKALSDLGLIPPSDDA